MSPSDDGIESASNPDPAEKTPQERSLRPLRWWPAVLLLVVMIALRVAPLLFEDGPPQLWMAAGFGPLLGSVLLLFWWLLLSRAAWTERLGGTATLILGVALAGLLLHPTMRGPGMIMLTIPIGFGAFAIGAAIGARARTTRRTAVALLLAWVGFASTLLLRAEGMWGDFALDLHPRWEPSAEERLVAASPASGTASGSTDGATDERLSAALAAPEWSEFRGPDRAGVWNGPAIETDWTANPPQELWRVPVGPGWSSFVVAGDRLFTQEQRGPVEVTVCYDAGSGSELWRREFEERFEDPLGGPGPRATPTLAAGGLFVQGATGIVARLDPRNGDVIWQRDLRVEASRTPPMWGFSASPLVVDEVVITYAGGAGDAGVLAWDAATGEPRWRAASGPQSYASPQLGVFGDRQLVMMLTDQGLDLLDPQTGAEAYGYDWEFDGYRAVQPRWFDGDTLIVPTGMGAGTRRVRLNVGTEFVATDLWTTRELKPDFNDFVVHEGYLYGFDQGLFTCVGVEEGGRAWRGGRYGKGQVLLLAKSDAMIVMTEQGEIVLLAADPTERRELGRIEAMEAKTWNHPVVVGDRLYVRNSEEAVCYRLTLRDAPDSPAAPTEAAAATESAERAESAEPPAND